MDFKKFVKWQAENPNRHVRIEIWNDSNGKQAINAWVYDHGLMSGQLVYSADEIDILGNKEKEERRTLDELLKKYGKEEASVGKDN
jgi:hypothetical protein